METIGSKRSYALTWCMPNNDDDDVYGLYRNGCATSEDILWKLEALQTFVADLHWPDEVFAEHISQRLETMSSEMVEAAAKRSVCVFLV